MKIGKFIKTVIYPKRVIPIQIPKRTETEQPIPIELPKREPAIVRK